MKGHIRERSPGHFAIVLEMRDAVTGKRKRKWHSFKGTKRQAQTECARLVAAMESGAYREPNKERLSELLERWLGTVKATVSPRTHERYAEIARKNIVPLLGSINVSKLTPADIATAYAQAQAVGTTAKGPLSAQSVTHMHRVLKQALGPVRWDRIHRNSEDRPVKPPKVEKREMRVLDIAQTIVMLDLVRTHRVFVPSMLAALCGLRRGEIAALRWCDADLEGATLSVQRGTEQTRSGVRYKETKRGRTRTVALSGRVIDELRTWRVKQAEELLRLGVRAKADTLICTTAAGDGIQPNSLTHEFAKAIDRTPLPRIRFHDLRHTHATHMLKSGVHVKVASERLGHSKIAITLDLYSHVLPGMQEDAVAKLDAAFDNARRS